MISVKKWATLIFINYFKDNSLAFILLTRRGLDYAGGTHLLWMFALLHACLVKGHSKQRLEGDRPRGLKMH